MRKKHEYSESSTSNCITCNKELDNEQRANLFDFCGGDFCLELPDKER